MGETIMKNRFRIGDIICHKLLNLGELLIVDVMEKFYRVKFITDKNDGFSTRLYKPSLYEKCDNIFKENGYES